MSDIEREQKVEEALATGDQDLIRQALEEYGDPFADEQDGAEDEAETTDDAEEAEESNDDSETDEAEDSDEAEDDSDGESSHLDENGNRYILSKDGTRQYPYGVLEGERKQRQESERRAEEAEKLAAETQRELNELREKFQANEKKIQNATANLERSGVDVDQAFDDPNRITDAEIKAIEADYGQNSYEAKQARIMQQMQANQQSNAQQVQQASVKHEQAEQSSQAEAQRIIGEAIAKNSDLASWQQSDPDRFGEAVRIDKKLQSDPRWKDKPLEERFAEAERRTKAYFGDPLTEKPPEKSGKSDVERAREKIKNAGQSAPDSLSDIGRSPSTEKSLKERLEGMNQAQLEAEMARMTPAQRKEILSW